MSLPSMLSSLRALAAVALSLVAACAHQQGAKDEGAEPIPQAAPLEEAEPTQPEPPPVVNTIATREASYEAAGVSMKGFIAYPSRASGKRPGVLVIHEWWGLNEYARKRATQLAELGYVALAADMFGEGKQASHPEDAKKFAGEVMSNLDEAQKRFEAAYAVLAGDPRVDADKIAAIGYCMGGAVVLHMARRGVDLDAVASFHGNLGTSAPMQPSAFSGQILVAHGGADPFVPAEQVEAFEKEMQAAGARYEVVVYPNAKHGFTNPEATTSGEKFGLPLAYDAEADAASWKRLEQLLGQVWSEG